MFITFLNLSFFVLDVFVCWFLDQLSQKEYEDDILDPLSKKKVPDTPCAMYFLILLWLFGLIPLFVCIFPHYRKKAKDYIQSVCDAFNAKYESSRGVHLEYVDVPRRKKTDEPDQGIKVIVTKPGEPIPGVELFTPSKDNLAVIQRYKNNSQSVQTSCGKEVQISTPDAVPSDMPYPM